MAYKGLGTQESPYIVDNWADFKELCGMEGVYLAFDPNAENKVIDINETDDRNGVTANIAFNANVEGNGWEIRNLNLQTFYFLGSGSGQNVIHDLHFKNIISGGWCAFAGWMHFADCTFSVLFTEDSCFVQSLGSTENLSIMENCAMRLHFLHTSGGILFYKRWRISNCTMYFSGTAEEMDIATASTIQNCSICGELDTNYTNVSFSNTGGSFNFVMIALRMKGGGTFYATKSTENANIVDVSLFSDNINVQITGKKWYKLTTEQMQNADYLMNTIGFPCVQVQA